MTQDAPLTPGWSPEDEIRADAAELTQDERDLVLMSSRLIVPKYLHRVHWDLAKREIVESEQDYFTRPLHVRLTARGHTLREVLEAGIADDDAPAWGILFRSSRELCWWMADAKGYHADIRFAGLYTRERAFAQHGKMRAGNRNNGRDEAIPPAKMLTLVAARQDDLQKEFDELGQQHAAIVRAFQGAER